MATGEVIINGVKTPLAADSQLPKGRRALTRGLRDAQPSDPSRLQSRSWNLSGPIGLSRQGENGELGHDWSDLETRFTNLVTSGPAVVTTSLSAADIPASQSGMYGDPKFGAADTKFGGTVPTPTVDRIHEDRNYLFYHRQRSVTQVDPSDFSVVENQTFPVTVKGAAVWKGKGYMGMGANLTMRRRLTVTSAGSTYEEALSNTFASAMEVGSDRLWMVQAVGSSNKAFFSLDALATVSDAFSVGDDEIASTGIGTIGPFTAFGALNGAYSFTDAGKTIRLLDVLRGHNSTENGRQWASLWGWLYMITDLGLYALRPGSQANPVGLGTMNEFEGFAAVPTAIFPWRESLLIAYAKNNGDMLLTRGEFNRRTDSTGNFDIFPITARSSTTTRAIFSTSTPTNPTVVWGEGVNEAHIVQGQTARDDLDSNYIYGVAGGTWYGSTLMENQHMLKTVREARFATENIVSGDSWTLRMSFDEASATTIGSAVTSNGYQIVRPVSASAPQATLSGHTLKPQLVQVAGGSGSSAAPPQIRGKLEILYDERPDKVEFVSVILLPRSRRTLKTAMATYRSDLEAGTPQKVVLPDQQGSVTEYGFVEDVQEVRDLAGDGVIGIQLDLVIWDVA